MLKDERFLQPYNSFNFLKDKKDIQSLSRLEKRKLLHALIKENADCFSFPCEILPHNRDQYCGCLRCLIKSIGIKKERVKPQIYENMKAAFDRLCEDSSVLNLSSDFVLNTAYPIKDFLKDVICNCEGLTPNQRNAVNTYFGFEIKDENNLTIDGFPALEEDLDELRQFDTSLVKNCVSAVRKSVQRFIYENRIICKNNPLLENELNIICQTFPEFKTLIGRIQHGVHDYTLDLHIIKVLGYVLQDESFYQLSDENKRILLVAVFLHDLTKAENRIDKTHPAQSAYIADMILDKTPIGQEQKNKIFTLIKNHDFLEKYNRKWSTVSQIASAFETKELFEMCCILTIADIKSVKADLSFYKRNYPVLLKAKSEILPLFK